METKWWREVDFVPQQDTVWKEGDESDAVEAIQSALRLAGYSISVDGVYGPGTARVVRRFQKDQGLAVDGIVGPGTQRALDGAEPDPKVLTQKDIEKAATGLEVHPAAVMAALTVESNGDGFFSNDKPCILFERHVMWRRLKEHHVNPTVYAASHPDIVNKSNGGYKGGVAEYARLGAAKRIHPEAAIESASWGLFQIMGYHWARLGYASATEFCDRMAVSEAEQLEALVRFIEADSDLHQAMKDQDWPTWARLYNGPAYAKNEYDVRLEKAFDDHLEDW